MSRAYGDENIASLTDLEAFRFKPTTYIKEVGLYGVMHMLKEVLTNSTDEFMAGFSKVIDIEVRTNNGFPSFMIKDTGRGIPIGKFEDSISKKNTSGKYGNVPGKGHGGYGASGGTFGIGVKLVNALSKVFTCYACRDGKKISMSFSEGVKNGDPVTVDYKGPSGTYTYWEPDIIPLREIDITDKRNEYMKYFEIVSYINAGIRINVKWDDEKIISYCHPEGINGYYLKLVKERRVSMIGKPHHIRWYTNDGSIGYDIVFGFNDGSGSGVVSFVNGIHTSDDGIHVSTFSETLSLVTGALNKGGFIPKAMVDKYTIKGDDVRESCFFIVFATVQDPEFDNQVKTKLASPQFKTTTMEHMRDGVKLWMSTNTDTFNKLGARCAMLARSKFEANKAKQNVLKAGTSVSDTFKNTDSRKFVRCNIVDPDRSEIFILEGDSAATSVKKTRNRDYQSVFLLKGKPVNMVKGGPISEEMRILVGALGIGYGKDTDISKLRYNKIIIMADADDDGAHIRSLMFVFFWVNYPELIKMGKVFFAEPPLYTISQKNQQNIYINTLDQLTRVLSRRATDIFRFVDYKGDELPDIIAEKYVENLPDYSKMLDNMSAHLGANPLLIEAITMDYNNVMHGVDKGIKNSYGWRISSFNILDGGVRRIGFEKDDEHYTLNIDRSMVRNVIKVVADFMVSKIRLARIVPVGRVCGKKHSGSFYEQGKLIHNSLFKASGFHIKRSKGLGAMTELELRDTTMDPATRFITCVSYQDVIETQKWVTWLFTNSDEKKDLLIGDSWVIE